MLAPSLGEGGAHGKAGRAMTLQGGRHLSQAGMELATLERRHLREFHLTLQPLPGEKIQELADRLGRWIRRHSATVVRHTVFGASGARERALEAFQKAMGPVDWPVFWIEGDEGRPSDNGAADALAGMQVWAVSGVPVRTVRWNDRPVGRSFEDGWARHLILADLAPPDPSAPRPDQARAVFELMAAALEADGMSMQDVARTWLYLENLLSWYGPFNRVRTEFFRFHRILGRRLPASTGIHGRNPYGAALLAGAWAVRPLDPAAEMREVASPLQCPAPKYGSSFSRAMELSTPDLRRLLVSGTASIAPDGSSARPNDLRGQIDLTMDVVLAILKSRGLSFADVTRAVTYFKRISDAPAFDAWRAEQGIGFFPTVSIQTDVCRDELLFEIEVDAAAPA